MTYVFLADALVKSGQLEHAILNYEESIRHNAAIQNWLAITGVVGTIASILVQRGQIKSALSQLTDVIDKVNAIGQTKSGSNPRIRRLSIWYEMNDLEAVQNDLDALWKLIQFEPTKSTAPFHLLSAQFQLAKGNRHGAEEAIIKCQQDVQGWTAHYDKARMLARIIRLQIQLGQLESVFNWFDSLTINFEHLTSLLIDEYIAYLDVLRLQNTTQSRDEGLGLVKVLYELCDHSSLEGHKLIVQCLEALLLAQSDDAIGALTPLRQALGFAEQQGYARTFVDFGQPMSHLLYEATARNIHAEYAGFLLTQFPEIADEKVQRQQAQDLIEPLSDREIEILALLAEGLSNQEIANQLFLSTGTVKVHNRNIFGKLGVKSRTQAVAKGRQLGILQDTES